MQADRTPTEALMVDLLPRPVTVRELLTMQVRHMGGARLVDLLPDVAVIVALGQSDAILQVALREAARREPETVGGLVLDAMTNFEGQALTAGPVTDAARAAYAAYVAWDDVIGDVADYPAEPIAALGALLAGEDVA